MYSHDQYRYKPLLSDEFINKWATPAKNVSDAISNVTKVTKRYYDRQQEGQNLLDKANYLENEDLANAEEVSLRNEDHIAGVLARLSASSDFAGSDSFYNIISKSIDNAEYQRKAVATHNEEVIKKLRERSAEITGVGNTLADLAEVGATTALKVLLGI